MMILFWLIIGICLFILLGILWSFLNEEWRRGPRP